MPDFSIGGLSTSTRMLTGFQSGIVTANGAISVIDDLALEMTSSFNRLVNAGTIFGEGLIVGSGAIRIDGGGNGVLNTGLISGRYAAITSYQNGTATDTNIYNSGSIVSQSNTILLQSGTTLTNTGDIVSFGFQEAIELTMSGLSPDTNEILNTGLISSGVNNSLALRLAGDIDKITNSGTIEGGISAGGADDRVVNSGLITGNVDMGADDDVFINRSSGEVTGSVAGGAGNDTLKGGDHEDDFAGGGGDDDLRGKNGDDTLDGGANDDDLRGGQGEDVLIGGGGGDKLRGGRDDDTLIGGTSLAGDKFIFNRKAGDDQILDFENGRDLIVLNAFGLRPADYASVLAPALSNAGNGATLLDLDALGGAGSVLIEGLKFSQADASDFVL